MTTALAPDRLPTLRGLRLVAAFGVLILLVRRIPRSRLPVPPGALTPTGPAVAPGVLDEPTVRFRFAHDLPVYRLPEFALGMVPARTVRDGRRPRAGVTAVVPVVFTVVCLGVAWPLHRLVESPLIRRFGSRPGRRTDTSPPEAAGIVRSAVRATQTGGSP
ncbi:hypothetical protein ACIBF1_30250 [Spirillospora sp. NPDC050679]